jgi:phage/plasmid-like protein (TIGR03299 family)
MPENVDTTVGMSYRPNFLATTSFDGSVKTTFKRTFTVAVCDNTVRIALAESGPTFAVAHRRNSLERLAEAPVALGLLDEASTAFTAHITKLSQQVVTDRQWARFLDRWTPVVDASGNELSKRAVTFATNKRDKLEKLWLDDPRVSPWKNTALGVSQAINTFTHHETAVRGDRVERNMLNTILGHTQTVDNDAARVLSLVLA